MLENDNLHGIGMLIRLRLVHGSHLVVYEVKSDGSDGCRVCFAAREFAFGANQKYPLFQVNTEEEKNKATC